MQETFSQRFRREEHEDKKSGHFHPEEQENPKPKAYSMTWAQRLKRVFAIDIEKCEKCGGPVRIIASIEDPDVIQKILKHLGLDQPEDPLIRSPPADLTDQQTTPF